MKPGDKIRQDTIDIIAGSHELAMGAIVVNHPRHGLVRIWKRENGEWTVESVERPSP